MDDPLGHRRQERVQATSGQLLLAARAVFEQKGYRATTVGAITAAASTAHGTFYLYFKNKEDAFRRVFAHVADELDEATSIPVHGDLRDSYHRAVDGYVAVVARHPGLWRCLMEGMYQSRSVEQMWLELRRPFIERLGRDLPPGGDTQALAVVLGSMIEWTAYTVVELGEPAGIGRQRAVQALVDVWCAAVSAPGTPPLRA